MTLTIQYDSSSELTNFKLPSGLQKRLQHLLDQQDSGIQLSIAEREEAEGLVDLAEFLTLLRLRAERLSS